MPLSYSKATIVANALLEAVAATTLFFRMRRLNRPSGGEPRLPRRILFVEPFGMGDVLSLSVTFDALRSAFPGAEIWLLTKCGNEALYEADSRVARTFVAPIPWSRLPGKKRGRIRDWIAVARTCREIAALEPDVGLDTRGEIRSQLLMVLCGCRRRIGFANYLNTNLNVRGRLLSTVVEKPWALHRYAMNRLLVREGLGIDVPEKMPSFRPEIPAARPEGAENAPVLLHVGARWSFRRWPEERWADLVRRLKEAGRSPCVVGSPAEEESVRRIARAGGCVAEIADMRRLIGLVKGCCALICLDSGPMHVAQTLGRPVVALFGPGDFELWHPTGPLDRSVFHRLSCNPCRQHECVRPGDPCMLRIEAEEVFERATEALERAGSAAWGRDGNG